MPSHATAITTKAWQLLPRRLGTAVHRVIARAMPDEGTEPFGLLRAKKK